MLYCRSFQSIFSNHSHLAVSTHNILHILFHSIIFFFLAQWQRSNQRTNERKNPHQIETVQHLAFNNCFSIKPNCFYNVHILGCQVLKTESTQVERSKLLFNSESSMSLPNCGKYLINLATADVTDFFFFLSIDRFYGKNQCCQCVKSYCEANKSSGSFRFQFIMKMNKKKKTVEK